MSERRVMAEPTQWALDFVDALSREKPANLYREWLASIADAARQQGYREGIASEEARHNAAAFKACEREISRLKHENKDLRECIRVLTPKESKGE